MGTGSFPGVKSGQGVTLTPHPLLVPWSRKGRAIPLLPLWTVWPVQCLSACTRVHLFFTLIKCRSEWTIHLRQCMDLSTNHDLRTIRITTSLSILSTRPPKCKPLFSRVDCDSLKPARLLICVLLIPAILIAANGASVTLYIIPCDCIANPFLYTLRRLPSKFVVRVVLTSHSTLHNLWIWNTFVK
jgi:hypothetical protein